jgi:hypothetical protein
MSEQALWDSFAPIDFGPKEDAWLHQMEQQFQAEDHTSKISTSGMSGHIQFATED